MVNRVHIFSVWLAVSLFAGCEEQIAPEVMTAIPEPTARSTKADPEFDPLRPRKGDATEKSALELCGKARNLSFHRANPERNKFAASESYLAFEELRTRGIFSEAELAKISEAKISLGMREIAVFCAWGVRAQKIPLNPAPRQTVEYKFAEEPNVYIKAYLAEHSVFVRDGRVVRVDPATGSKDFERIEAENPKNTAPIYTKEENVKYTGLAVVTSPIWLPVAAFCELIDPVC